MVTSGGLYDDDHAGAKAAGDRRLWPGEFVFPISQAACLGTSRNVTLVPNATVSAIETQLLALNPILSKRSAAILKFS